MTIHEQAASIAKTEGKWHAHPNKKRTTQEIQFVKNLNIMYHIFVSFVMFFLFFDITIKHN